MALEDLNDQDEDSSLPQMSSLFEQAVSLLRQSFNAISYHPKESIQDMLIDRKAKVKEILRENSNSLNNFDN